MAGERQIGRQLSVVIYYVRLECVVDVVVMLETWESEDKGNRKQTIFFSNMYAVRVQNVLYDNVIVLETYWNENNGNRSRRIFRSFLSSVQNMWYDNVVVLET